MSTDEKRPHLLYRPEYAEQVYNYCLLGASNKQLATIFDVTDRTIDNWIAHREDFGDAVKRGRMIADSEVAAACYRRAIGYSYTSQHINKKGELITVRTEMPPDVNAQVFWLSRRQRDMWAPKTDLPLGDESGMLAPIGSAALVEAARRIAFILARATQGEVTTVEPKEIENDKSAKRKTLI